MNEKPLEYVEKNALLLEIDKAFFESDPENADQQIALLKCRRIIREYPAAKVAPRWIPETERLPEHNKKVLCRSIDGSCSVMLYNHFESGWKTGIFSVNLYCRGLITHWMPLPEPPDAE